MISILFLAAIVLGISISVCLVAGAIVKTERTDRDFEALMRRARELHNREDNPW